MLVWIVGGMTALFLSGCNLKTCVYIFNDTQARVKDDGIKWRLGEECADDKILKCHPRDRISKTTFFRTEKVRAD